ncbi:hypothetical protein CY34DRAFT_159164 [Suillus luteus UH-Slu-Lm8-n1]|uniref:Uncharacterized protein n=1 Tax=Suillus luteus UH-Slu-Lm8-n1 TaxID=930992 RepID=A0A0D0AK27_9AGAM|nr:hypothetical protein CY34DRAFT_159164 [Suillus luteus UH-Slu-Lm8-n1]
MMGCPTYVSVLVHSLVTPVDSTCRPGCFGIMGSESRTVVIMRNELDACGWIIIRETFLSMTLMYILHFLISGTVQFAIFHRPPLVRNEATCHRPYTLILRLSQKLQIS